MLYGIPIVLIIIIVIVILIEFEIFTVVQIIAIFAINFIARRLFSESVSSNQMTILGGHVNQSFAEEARYLRHTTPDAPHTDQYSRILELDDPDKRQPYYQREEQFIRTLHWGQLKLFLSELEFLTKVIQDANDREIWFIYAGAAPGDHIPYLHSLFPSIHFELYDPNDFAFEPTDMIKTYVQFFTEEDAQKWANQSDKYIAFCSDIRSEPATNENVERNMKMQREWWEIMNPDLAMFKFRLPWSVGKTSYMKGDIYIQAYPGHNSTETRLIVERGAPMVDYDNIAYEEACAYHNCVSRVMHYEQCGNFLLDKCYDCMTFEYLVRQYLELKSVNVIDENVEYLIRDIELHATRHGRATVESKTADAFSDQVYQRQRRQTKSRATIENEQHYRQHRGIRIPHTAIPSGYVK